MPKRPRQRPPQPKLTKTERNSLAQKASYVGSLNTKAVAGGADCLPADNFVEEELVDRENQ